VSSHVPAAVCSPFEHEAPHADPATHVPAHAPTTHVAPPHGVVDVSWKQPCASAAQWATVVALSQTADALEHVRSA